MDVNNLLQKIQTPEQIKALALKLAKAGRPPQGMPGMKAPAAPQPAAPAPMAPTPPAANSLGDILGGFGNG